MLKMNLRVGESVRIGDAVVTLEEKNGRSARLSIQADKSVSIQRVEQTTAAQLAQGGIGIKKE